MNKLKKKPGYLPAMFTYRACVVLSVRRELTRLSAFEGCQHFNQEFLDHAGFPPKDDQSPESASKAEQIDHTSLQCLW